MQNADGPPVESDATADQILDVAETLIQRRGYNAVSYADLAEVLDLSTAAIHYHFPSKGDLVRALVQRFRRENTRKRKTLHEQNDTLREQLTQYVELFSEIMDDGGLCLCGILAADKPTLPEEVRGEVRRFFAEQEDWLTDLLEAETSGGAGLEGCNTARDAARLFLAALEGAMLTTPGRNPDVYTKRSTNSSTPL